MIVARHAISEGFGLGAWLGRSHDRGGASEGKGIGYAARVRVRMYIATGEQVLYEYVTNRSYSIEVVSR